MATIRGCIIWVAGTACECDTATICGGTAFIIAGCGANRDDIRGAGCKFSIDACPCEAAPGATAFAGCAAAVIGVPDKSKGGGAYTVFAVAEKWPAAETADAVGTALAECIAGGAVLAVAMCCGGCRAALCVRTEELADNMVVVVVGAEEEARGLHAIAAGGQGPPAMPGTVEPGGATTTMTTGGAMATASMTTASPVVALTTMSLSTTSPPAVACAAASAAFPPALLGFRFGCSPGLRTLCL